jgi:hypothetical protein
VVHGVGDRGGLRPGDLPPPECRQGVGERPGQRDCPLDLVIGRAGGQPQRDADLVAGQVSLQAAVLGRGDHRGQRHLLLGVDPGGHPLPDPDQVDPGVPVQGPRVQPGHRTRQRRTWFRGQRRLHQPPTRLRRRHQPGAALLPHHLVVKVRGAVEHDTRRVENVHRHAGNASGDHRQFLLARKGFRPF